MSDFDPNAFLAQAANQPLPEQPVGGGAPAPGGFDPDAFIQEAKEQKYGTPGQMVQTALEGAGQGFLSAAAPFIQTKVLGQDPTAIRERAEVNPVTHGVGEAAGLIGGAIADVGLPSVLSKAGAAAEGLTAAGRATGAAEKAATALGLEGKLASNFVKDAVAAQGITTLQKVGSAAVKGAAENALYQAGVEGTKYVLNDPGLSAESAITDVGLAAAIGGGISGALGTVHPIWNATLGPKTDELLTALTNRLNGTGGPSEVVQMARGLGIELAPEVEAALSEDPLARTLASKLNQTDTTKVGRTFQQTLREFRESVDAKVLEISGRNAVPSETSAYEVGKNLAETAAKEFETKIGPTVEKLENAKAQLKDEALLPDTATTRVDSTNPYKMETVIENQPGTVRSLSERIAQIAEENQWMTGAGSDEKRMILKALKDLGGAKTIGNLIKIGENIGQATKSTLPFNVQTPLSRAGTLVRNAIDEAVHDVSIARLGVKNAAAAAELITAKAEFAAAAKVKDALEASVKSGARSVSGFGKMLRAMGLENGEAVLNRMSGKGDARLIEVLKEHFPQTAEAVRQFHMDDLVKRSTKLDQKGIAVLDVNKFVKNLEKMSPELRDFVYSKEQQGAIATAHTLARRLEDKTHNFSNTGRTVDKLAEQFGSSALGAIAFLTGHGALGFMAPFAGSVYKEGLDAARVGMLKFLGSSQPVNAAGFKAMVDFVERSTRGQSMLNKAITSVFKTTGQVVPSHLMPDDKDRKKLDKQVSDLQEKPNDMIRLMKGDVAHYMPENQTALTEAQARAVQYLQSVKPQPYRPSPLGREIPPSAAETARYNRALDIANHPPIVLQKVKDGTVQISDLKDLNSMYPALYKQMAQKLSHEMTLAHDKGAQIPYATRMGLSLFLGQAVDASMTQTAIMAAQPQPEQPAPQQGGRTKGSPSKLGKTNMDYMTPLQASEQHKLKK